MIEERAVVSEYIVKSFDEELENLVNTIAEMGGIAESMLADATVSLRRRDSEKARQVIETDRRVDALERQVSHLTMRLLALRQPVATDLRQVVAALKTSADIERIGDYAANIAKRTVTLTGIPANNAVNTIVRLSQLVQAMIKDVLDAYVNLDEAKARDVRDRDMEVDSLHTSLFRELLTYMMEDPRNITSCSHLLFVAKNVERTGDLATNIAEHVLFMIVGEEPDDSRPKRDKSSYTVVDPPEDSERFS